MKDYIHFTPSYLLNPTNPVTVSLIGAGGTGSHILTCLAKIHVALTAMEHPGLEVTLYDGDRINEFNAPRQLFLDNEVGMFKSAALINRVNRFFGLNWKAKTAFFDKSVTNVSNLYISCVDSVKSRFEVADFLKSKNFHLNDIDTPYYWLDFGNSKSTAQAIISTITPHTQPKSTKYKTVSKLPFITDEFKDMLISSEEKDQTPSCSVADALSQQDLFINPNIANMGAALLWSLFKNGFIRDRGVFLNIDTLRSSPLPLAG